jgi:hypothetical protein
MRIFVAAGFLLFGFIAQFVSTSALAQGGRFGSRLPTGSQVPKNEVPSGSQAIPKNQVVASLEINAISAEPFQSTDTIDFSWSLQNTTPVLLTGRLGLFVDQNHIQATFPNIQNLAKGATLDGLFTVGPLPSGAHVVTLKFNQSLGLRPAPRVWGQAPTVVPTFVTLGTAEQQIIIVDVVPPPPTHEQLAAYWAPVISQDVDAANVRADYITTFNYDGDWSAWNNWNNLDSFDLPSAVYYWVIESPDRYFIGYAFFHPRDWSSSGGDEHENDLEGALLSIAKDSTLAHGRFEGMVTQAHGPFFSFADDDTPESSEWFKLVSLSQKMTGKDEDVDFVVDDFGLHPVIYLQAEGHGAYGHPFRGQKNAWDYLDDWAPIFIRNKITDWRGADWTGVPAPPVSGAVLESYSKDGWGDGIIYHYEPTPDLLGGKGVTSSSTLTHDWQVAGYALVSIKNLWDRRNDYVTSPGIHHDPDTHDRVFSGPGNFGPSGGAQAPWGWGDGSFFVDPARFMANKFGGWSGAVPQSCAYVGNSFGAPRNGCPPKD